MSGAMFMEIDGIKGESQFKGHEGQIDIESWSWGLTQPTSTHTGGGGTSGKANVGDLSFVHLVDKSSPNLMQACFLGKHIPSALLTQREAAGDDSVAFLTLKMTDLVISGVNTGANGEAKPVESVNLNFAKVEIEYKEQDEKGKPKGGPVKAGFDIKKNVKV